MTSENRDLVSAEGVETNQEAPSSPLDSKGSWFSQNGLNQSPNLRFTKPIWAWRSGSSTAPTKASPLVIEW